MSDDAIPPYRVVFSQLIRDQLRNYARHAATLGMLSGYLDTLRVVQHSLANDPLGWGDPQYRLRRLGLLMCHGSYGLLHVYYGIDEEHRLVFIKDCRPMPGSPLAQGPDV